MRLDCGCGIFKKEGYVGIDSYDHSKRYKKDEFILGTIPEILELFDDNSIEEVRANHFIEHIPQNQVIETFNEIYRILIPGGVFTINVPPIQSPDGKACRGAHADPTHRSFWNDMSFRYFDKTWCKELTESYGITANFQIVENKFLNECNLHVILKKR